jgi:Odorant response abnormal 4-like
MAARYETEIEVPISGTGGLREHFDRLVGREGRRIRAAVGLLAGAPVREQAALGDVAPAASSAALGVDLLVPLQCSAPGAAAAGKSPSPSHAHWRCWSTLEAWPLCSLRAFLAVQWHHGPPCVLNALPARQNRQSCKGLPVSRCSAGQALGSNAKSARYRALGGSRWQPHSRGGVVPCAGSGVSSSDIVGGVRMNGVIEGCAYVHRREPASAAVELLKQDLERSLRVRLALLVEEAEDAAAADEGGNGERTALPPMLLRPPTKVPVAVPLPARAFVAIEVPRCCAPCEHARSIWARLSYGPSSGKVRGTEE